MKPDFENLSFNSVMPLILIPKRHIGLSSMAQMIKRMSISSFLCMCNYAKAPYYIDYNVDFFVCRMVDRHYI